MMNGRAQSVGDADRDIRQYLVRVAAMLGDALGDRLTALFVHGSLATGAYRRDWSDIDLIAVVRHALAPAERAQLARVLVRLSDARPVRGDIELTVISEYDARHFNYPTPYELHYSAVYHEAFRRGTFDFAAARTSRDLPVRIFDTRERGVVLVGARAPEVFAPVPWHAYIAGLHADFERMRLHAADHPVQATLGACRVLNGTTSRSMTSLNKDEAARWALRVVPATFQSTIRDALNVYRGDKTLDDVVFDEAAIRGLGEYVHDHARIAFERAEDDGEE